MKYTTKLTIAQCFCIFGIGVAASPLSDIRSLLIAALLMVFGIATFEQGCEDEKGESE